MPNVEMIYKRKFKQRLCKLLQNYTVRKLSVEKQIMYWQKIISTFFIDVLKVEKFLL